MASQPPQSGPGVISRPGARPEGVAPQASAGGFAGVVEKFRSLPRPAQIGIVVGAVIFVYFVFGNRSHTTVRQPAQNLNMGVTNGTSPTFTGLETDRPALMQSVFEQNRRDMSDMRAKIEQYFQEQSAQKSVSDAKTEELQRQMQQMMGDFTAELKNIQTERMRDSERLGQLAEQQRQMEMNAPTDGSSGVSPIAGRRRQITQVNLGGGGGVATGRGALLAPLGQALKTGPRLDSSGQFVDGGVISQAEARLPFMPPIGFVKGTLLNGVDAPIGSEVMPALVRLSGIYKTAMNTTVKLDGCIAVVNFGANISTERAVGKPTKMTCIYPDGGAATYSLSGYVVDAEDGIIGMPGVLYEGDATRITAAALADFAAGVGEIIAQNQQTTTVDSNGTAQTALTGDQSKAQLAGGLNKSMSTLRDYLKERVDRVQSFIRIDATREINLVILNGTELRKEGEPWTDLFDATAADNARNNPNVSTQAPAGQRQQPQGNSN